MREAWGWCFCLGEKSRPVISGMRWSEMRRKFLPGDEFERLGGLVDVTTW